MKYHTMVFFDLLLLGIVFSLSACVATDVRRATSTALQVTTSPTQTIVPFATPTIAPTITNTATETSQPIETKTPTQNPTLTPLLTLLPDEAMNLVVELLHTNAGCQLPCYWGFIPGETAWDEAGQFLESFADYYSTRTDKLTNTTVSEVIVVVPEEIDPYLYLGQISTIRDNIIDRIRVQAGNIPTYTLSTFLNTNGPPDEIWVAPGREETNAFIIRLFYPKRGILANYSGFKAEITDMDVLICPRDESNPSLTLWKPTERKSFLDLHSEILGHEDDEAFLFYQIEEVTDMDVETFYATYSDPDADICFRVPRAKWPDLRIIP